MPMKKAREGRSGVIRSLRNRVDFGNFEGEPRLLQATGMERLLTPSEASELLGVSIATLYTWAYRGRIPVQKVGRALRFSPTALDTWLKTQTRPVRDRWGAP